ncbi:MAG: DKNYY domain-containing protein [Bacteroidota bacterium]
MVLKIIGIVVLLLVILIAGLGIYLRAGYKLENGEWAWVSYDEAAGKRIRKLAEVDQESFEILKDKRYGKDKAKVFFLGRPIEDANPQTFELLSKEGYARDDQYVFLDRIKLVQAHPQSFKTLRFPYAEDQERIYCGTIPLNLRGEELEEFRVKKGSSMRVTFLLSSFVEQYPEYAWLDTLGIESVIVGEGSAETNTKRFDGYRERAK